MHAQLREERTRIQSLQRPLPVESSPALRSRNALLATWLHRVPKVSCFLHVDNSSCCCWVIHGTSADRFQAVAHIVSNDTAFAGTICYHY